MAQKKQKYKPNIAALIHRKATLSAKSVEQVEKVVLQRKVSRMVIRGKSYDHISAKLGISVKEAVDCTRDITKNWLTDQAIEAPALREIENRRLDALYELAMYNAFPHPEKDSVGNPILARCCDCSDDPEDAQKPCIFEDHNKPVMSKANKDWAEFAMKVGQRRAALIGLDAADKFESQKMDLLERVYKGVAPAVIDKL